jgi:sugar phosphate isomerase/epimerase
MRLGIFAKTFDGAEPAKVLRAVRAAGFDCAQFNLACAGLASMPDEVPPAALAGIREASSETGVELVALSGTYNMIHPDPARRAAGLRQLGVVIEAASALAIPMVTLCTGTRDPDDQWRHHPGNSAPDAWMDLLREMEQATMLAEAAGVDLGVEPELANVVSSATLARRLIGEIASARIRIVLDPANLFEQGDRNLARRLAADAIDRLSDRIAMAHAKDRQLDGSVATAGKGVVDFPDFVARLRQAGFAGPLVTHGLSPTKAPEVAAFLSGLIAP